MTHKVGTQPASVKGSGVLRRKDGKVIHFDMKGHVVDPEAAKKLTTREVTEDGRNPRNRGA